MAARDFFRMPKGVPREIARALNRSSSRRIPRAGQALSYENALILHDLLSVVRPTLQSPFTKAVRAMDRARTTKTREKWSAVAQKVRTQAERIDRAVHELEAASGIEPLPPLASRDVVPTVDTDFEGPDYVLPEEGGEEAEIGVDYTEEEGWSHLHGHTSDVAFNARLYWRPGWPITESDVRDAMGQFASDGTLPQGMGVRAVSWANWKGQERTGGASDLENFRAILQAVGDRGMRVGIVKGDRL